MIITLSVLLALSFALCAWLYCTSHEDYCELEDIAADTMTCLDALRAHHLQCMSDSDAYARVCHQSIAHLRSECSMLMSERDVQVRVSSDLIVGLRANGEEMQAMIDTLRNN